MTEPLRPLGLGFARKPVTPANSLSHVVRSPPRPVRWIRDDNVFAFQVGTNHDYPYHVPHRANAEIVSSLRLVEDTDLSRELVVWRVRHVPAIKIADAHGPTKVEALTEVAVEFCNSLMLLLRLHALTYDSESKEVRQLDRL